MPVEGFPLAFEIMLDSLLKANQLSTWKVTGGDKHIAVTLRFNMADIKASQTESVSFKRVPPSQQRRSFHRRQKWLQDKNMDKNETSDDNRDLDDFENSIVEESSNNRLSCDTESKTGPSHSGPRELPQCTLTHKSSMSDHQDQCVQVSDSEEQNSISDTEIEQQHDLDSSSESADTCTLLQPDENYGVCDVCLKPFYNAKVLMTCTQCDNFAVCTTCKEFDFSSRHTTCDGDQMHMYNVPGLIKADCNCDSCGMFFQNSRSKLYECQKCDNFILCRKCMDEGMHKYHTSAMKAMTRKQYKTS